MAVSHTPSNYQPVLGSRRPSPYVMLRHLASAAVSSAPWATARQYRTQPQIRPGAVLRDDERPWTSRRFMTFCHFALAAGRRRGASIQPDGSPLLMRRAMPLRTQFVKPSSVRAPAITLPRSLLAAQLSSIRTIRPPERPEPPSAPLVIEQVSRRRRGLASQILSKPPAACTQDGSLEARRDD